MKTKQPRVYGTDMMKKILLLKMLLVLNLFGADLHYSLFKKTTNKGPTLLVIGGIHGNEPGGYFAPAILKNHYKISRGNLWIVPNLNFDSIVMNQRGIYNDMNRKFASIDAKDPDFEIVNEIKELTLEKRVDLILNLHDGHGFFRERTVNSLCNPKAWGQACIIDQQKIPGAKFGNLSEIAKRVNKETNINLFEDVHEFNVKNTHTKEKDVAMQQSLTYFAIQHKKPALAIETSKNIVDLDLKVYYQLKSIEEFMKIMGIKFSKDFELNRESIKEILEDNGVLEFPTEHTSLPLNHLKPLLNDFPMNKELKYFSANPLVALLKEENGIKVMNGNIFLTQLKPEYYEFDDSLHDIHMEIDSKEQVVQPGSIIDVKQNFKVLPQEGYRVNVIGFSSSKSDEETDIEIAKTDMLKRFSIDTDENIYRVEFYKEKKFSGMVLVRFK
jgi:hypothetical protein